MVWLCRPTWFGSADLRGLVLQHVPGLVLQHIPGLALQHITWFGSATCTWFGSAQVVKKDISTNIPGLAVLRW